MELADPRAQARIATLCSIETYNPASYRGGIHTLHYARAQEIEPWLVLVAVRGVVIVRYWRQPGAAETLGPGKEWAVVGQRRRWPTPRTTVAHGGSKPTR